MSVEARDFTEGQRQQMMHLGTPGQRLADRCRQRKILRAAENPAAGGRIVVNDALQIGEEIGRTLHLVEDRPFGKLGQERPGIVRRERAFVRSLQCRVGAGAQHCIALFLDTIAGIIGRRAILHRKNAIQSHRCNNKDTDTFNAGEQAAVVDDIHSERGR